MLNVIRRLFVQHRLFLIACATVLAGFQFLLCAIVASIDLENALEQMMAFAPPIMQSVIEQSMLGGSTAGVLAFAWNHPITHALMAASAIVLGARAIAGEIENGMIEQVLAQPISRLQYLAAHLLFAMVCMALIALAGVIATVIGQGVFELNVFGWERLLPLWIAVFLLQLSFYALTLLLSSIGREGGRVAAVGVILVLISFLVSVIATLWSKAAFIKPYSLHRYYDPRAILVDGRLATSSVVLLASFSLVAISAAYARFGTRDLP
jgi:ABC-2 type transport system permease protein